MNLHIGLPMDLILVKTSMELSSDHSSTFVTLSIPREIVFTSGDLAILQKRIIWLKYTKIFKHTLNIKYIVKN